MAEILHENNKVWLDVDPYYPPKHKHPNTAFKATAIATQAMGEGLRYELLMGISGAAFRVQLHEEWCPSSPHPNCGFDCSAIAMAAIEFRTLPLFDCAADAARQPSTQDAIIASIDRGHPVLLCAKETGLVVGYLADGDERQLLIREPYSNRGDEPVPLEERPWGFIVFTDHPRMPNSDALVNSLKLATKLAHTGRTGERSEYACGFAAYEAWMADLLDEEKIVRLKKGDEPELSNANAHIYYCLIDARQCAAEHLRALAGDLAEPTQPHLRQAAAHYDDIAARLGAGMKNLMWSSGFDEGKKWTQAMREAQTCTLSEVVALERTAIAEIENAISLLQ